jgi:hypothetical protein
MRGPEQQVLAALAALRATGSTIARPPSAATPGPGTQSPQSSATAPGPDTQSPQPSAAAPVPGTQNPQPSAATDSVDTRRIYAALHKATLILTDTRDPLAISLRHELHAETGHSLPMIEWGLLTSLTSLRHTHLLGELPETPSDELIGVILAGNVFVAALRGIALPLLVGARVIVKTASHEGAFARALQAALQQADASIGARLAIVSFSRDDTRATEALCSGVDALSVYGSDETVEQLRIHHARIIPHGHGLSAAFVARSALQTQQRAEQAAERIALDIAAYDQHGCLSPHFVLVEQGAAVAPQAFAQLLAAQGPTLEALLPSATPTLDEQAEHMQWRATAAVRGELTSDAVSFEPAPLRPSPGGRHVSVYACHDARALLEPFAKHLKCIGVAGTKEERSALADQFQGAQVVRAGEMQTPAFDTWADGAHPLAGLGLLKHR